MSSKPTERAWVSILAVVVTVLYVTGIVFWAFLNVEELSPNELGDLVGGTTAPAAFFWLIWGYFLQRRELREAREQFEKQADALQQQAGFDRQQVFFKHIEAARVICLERITVLESSFFDFMELEWNEFRGTATPPLSFGRYLLDAFSDSYTIVAKEEVVRWFKDAATLAIIEQLTDLRSDILHAAESCGQHGLFRDYVSTLDWMCTIARIESAQRLADIYPIGASEPGNHITS